MAEHEAIELWKGFEYYTEEFGLFLKPKEI